ncbi:Rossmann-like and DUF2520 domain-containing protein [Prevotella sp. OH937_COT-195]|uniref:Rossmann-like and DUF2520 domain-containing protein n=1 Tax=Prevotella sp. OH937_COT-195 TaxID=2491051 RepID=UPI001F19E823|nr:DUF2520 domain-containing protein [Prevotella sp. OH937_COT-195]
MSGDIKRIVIIGAGNLATNLGEALLRQGIKVEQVFSRTERSAESLAKRLGSRRTTSFDGIVTGADLYIVSVKDCVLDIVLPKVLEKAAGGIVVHTAGSVPLSVFGDTNVAHGVFYPMQTFSKQKNVNFREISIFVEASDERTCEVLECFSHELTEKVYRLDSEKRRYLHVAAVFVCNFANHCFAIADDLLSAHNIPFSVMLPLINETVKKLEMLSPRESQTGPAARRDIDVINEHLELIESPVARDIYEIMSKSIMGIDK